MIDKSFVEAIVDLAKTEKVILDGKEYSTQAVFEAVPNHYDFPTIHLNSLDGLVDYVKGNIDEQEMTKCQIICAHDKVEVVGQPLGEQRIRDMLAVAHSGAQFTGLSNWLDQESFRIWMATQFEPTPDRDAILVFLTKIVDESIKTSEDNGISQIVTAKVGVAAVGPKEVPSPLKLKPLRTFLEIDQPDGTFVFRLRKTSRIEMALFEVATNWQRTAALDVQVYLEKSLDGAGVTVLA
jgi:hypothetical protein